LRVYKHNVLLSAAEKIWREIPRRSNKNKKKINT